MKKQTLIECNLDSTYWKLTKGRIAQRVKTFFYNGEFHVKGKWVDSGEVFELPSIFFKEMKGASYEWNLFDVKEDPKTKELALYYAKDDMIFSFIPHPTKAFVFEARELKGINTAAAFRKVLDSWLQNAIGPAETYYERILSFNN